VLAFIIWRVEDGWCGDDSHSNASLVCLVQESLEELIDKRVRVRLEKDSEVVGEALPGRLVVALDFLGQGDNILR
jgi:hypothetical protein